MDDYFGKRLDIEYGDEKEVSYWFGATVEVRALGEASVVVF